MINTRTIARVDHHDHGQPILRLLIGRRGQPGTGKGANPGGGSGSRWSLLPRSRLITLNAAAIASLVGLCGGGAAGMRRLYCHAVPRRAAPRPVGLVYNTVYQYALVWQGFSPEGQCRASEAPRSSVTE